MNIPLLKAVTLSFFFLSAPLYSANDAMARDIFTEKGETDGTETHPFETSQLQQEPAPIYHPTPNLFSLEEEVSEPNTDHFFVQLMKMFATLGVLIAIMLLASFALKRVVKTRVQQMNVSSAIKVIESRNLSNKSAVYLVEVEDKILLVGETLHSLSLLATFNHLSDTGEERQN